MSDARYRTPFVLAMCKLAKGTPPTLGELADAEEAIIAAARAVPGPPLAVRALLSVELSMAGMYRGLCPECRYGNHDSVAMHREGCAIDVALTAAGFPDAASRDAARERMRAGA